MSTYTISQVAEIMGVSTHTLRFYDKEGLLPPVDRVGGRRVFHESDFAWLRILNCLKNTGMPLKDIRHYFELAQGGDSTLQERYEMILRQKQAILDQISALEQNLKEVEYKEWYYRSAMEAGTEKIHADRPCSVSMEPDQIPEHVINE